MQLDIGSFPDERLCCATRALEPGQIERRSLVRFSSFSILHIHLHVRREQRNDQLRRDKNLLIGKRNSKADFRGRHDDRRDHEGLYPWTVEHLLRAHLADPESVGLALVHQLHGDVGIVGRGIIYQAPSLASQALCLLLSLQLFHDMAPVDRRPIRGVAVLPPPLNLETQRLARRGRIAKHPCEVDMQRRWHAIQGGSARRDFQTCE
mmetsp:Transcript_116525/g.336610  ORF Transcript_116525/g.336610 Transcript_116525/m.336610 type:complete len:207 (+) Transcript_116525:887-1507(+)